MKVVNDREVCAAFEKILWVSVGQEPDVRELLGSVLKQINKQTLKPDLSDQQAFAEVKDAEGLASEMGQPLDASGKPSLFEAKIFGFFGLGNVSRKNRRSCRSRL